jgi:hypothetical protein
MGERFLVRSSGATSQDTGREQQRIRKGAGMTNRRGCTVLLALLLGLLAGSVDAKPDRTGIDAFLKAVKGQDYYLRMTVIRIKMILGGKDVTNVLPGPEMSYRAKFGGFNQIQSSSAEEFAEEARLANQNIVNSGGLSSTVRSYGRGTRVTITKYRIRNSEIQIDIKEQGGSKTKIRFKFNNDPDSYSLATVEEMFAFLFAENAEDLEEQVVEIELGMSIEDVIELKGNPKSRINLGAKTILTYEDMKIVFTDGKLSDVQ